MTFTTRFSLSFLVVLLGFSASCNRRSENSETKSFFAPCPILTVKGEPQVIYQGGFAKVTLELVKTSLMNCTFAAYNQQTGALLNFGMEDIFNQSLESSKVSFTISSFQMPNLKQLQLAVIEGFTISQVLYGPGAAPAARQQAGSAMNQETAPASVSCSGNSQKQQISGSSQTSCSTQTSQSPQLTPRMQLPATGAREDFQCSYSSNNRTYTGNTRAECEELRRLYGMY